jgi:hypothetical protein
LGASRLMARLNLALGLMRLSLRASLALLLCALSSQSNATDWYPLISKDGTQVFVDQKSILTQGDYVRAWMLWDIPNGVGVKTRDRGFFTAHSIKSLYVFSCSGKQHASLREISFTQEHATGQVIIDLTFAKSPKTAKWYPALPETIFLAQLNALCAQVGLT